MDGESPKTNMCIFNASEEMEAMRNFEQVNKTKAFESALDVAKLGTCSVGAYSSMWSVSIHFESLV